MGKDRGCVPVTLPAAVPRVIVRLKSYERFGGVVCGITRFAHG